MESNSKRPDSDRVEKTKPVATSRSSACYREIQMDPERPYPEGIAFDEACRQRQRADAMEASRDAWRTACRYLYTVIGEGGKRGRPMDLIDKLDYQLIVELIGTAETQEPKSR